MDGASRILALQVLCTFYGGRNCLPLYSSIIRGTTESLSHKKPRSCLCLLSWLPDFIPSKTQLGPDKGDFISQS